MWYYEAFGLQICSDIELLQLTPAVVTTTEINIKLGDVPLDLEGDYIDYHWIKIKGNEVLFTVLDVASYHIKNGNTITIQLEKNNVSENMALVQMYLMGTAMGALLIQRGIVPLHGSCVRKSDGTTVLFTGESGAGKSTTAAYFVSEDWRIMSDDVTPVQIKFDTVMAYPSFPQQKLWDDAVERHVLDSKKAKLLWEKDERQKFAMHSVADFYDKKERLDCVIQLIPKEQNEITYREVFGVEKAILLREHTYRNFLYADNTSKQIHFQQCAKMAEKLKVFQIFRPIGKVTERQIFETIEHILEETSCE